MTEGASPFVQIRVQIRQVVRHTAKALYVHTTGMLTAYAIAYVFGCIYTQRSEHFPPFSPSISHGTSSFQIIVGYLF